MPSAAAFRPTPTEASRLSRPASAEDQVCGHRPRWIRQDDGDEDESEIMVNGTVCMCDGDMRGLL